MAGETKKKVLVVEDNPMNKILVRDILIANGYDVVEADTGSDAIKKVAAERPNLILMDLNLPEMDGITATKILKSGDNCKGIPIIALTASAMKMEVEKTLSEGFDGYISKPIEMKKFIKYIASYFGK
ncbi:MAG: response regulator [Deltaproteobacteria bacterium]|nr:response regulator [Deltaproteobacteria bacterium]